jgi:hypothetical protein
MKKLSPERKRVVILAASTAVIGATVGPVGHLLESYLPIPHPYAEFSLLAVELICFVFVIKAFVDLKGKPQPTAQQEQGDSE